MDKNPLPVSGEAVLLYEFKCEKHGRFIIKQSILEKHKAVCPECGLQAQRIYSSLDWFWADNKVSNK